MTALRYTPEPRWRESIASFTDRSKRRPIIVALQPECLVLRLKGTRQQLRLPYGLAYQRAAFIAADEARRQKREARKAGRP